MNAQTKSALEVTDGAITHETDKGDLLVWERPRVERLGADQAETSNYNAAANDGLIYTS
jgi:hypothetical protein